MPASACRARRGPGATCSTTCRGAVSVLPSLQLSTNASRQLRQPPPSSATQRTNAVFAPRPHSPSHLQHEVHGAAGARNRQPEASRRLCARAGGWRRGRPVAGTHRASEPEGALAQCSPNTSNHEFLCPRRPIQTLALLACCLAAAEAGEADSPSPCRPGIPPPLPGSCAARKLRRLLADELRWRRGTVTISSVVGCDGQCAGAAAGEQPCAHAGHNGPAGHGQPSHRETAAAAAAPHQTQTRGRPASPSTKCATPCTTR